MSHPPIPPGLVPKVLPPEDVPVKEWDIFRADPPIPGALDALRVYHDLHFRWIKSRSPSLPLYPIRSILSSGRSDLTVREFTRGVRVLEEAGYVSRQRVIVGGKRRVILWCLWLIGGAS